jgi:hypothetical protein
MYEMKDYVRKKTPKMACSENLGLMTAKIPFYFIPAKFMEKKFQEFLNLPFGGRFGRSIF